MSVLPRAVTHNLSLKVLAFVVAWVLWAIVPADNSTQRETLSAIPIRVQVGDADWALAADPFPAEVSVRFSGATRDVIRLVREGTSVRVPIEAVSGPDTVVQLSRDWVVLPTASELVVEEIIPASLSLTFEQTRSVDLPLAIALEGELDPEFALTEPVTVTPASVRVRGPSRLLDAVDSIRLQPLDLGSVSRTGSISVPIDTVGLGGLLPERTAVDVNVRLEPAAERRFPVLAVEAPAGAARPLRIEPATVGLTLRGAPALLERVGIGELRVRIATGSLDGLEVGDEREVALRLEGVPPLITALLDTETVRVIRP